MDVPRPQSMALAKRNGESALMPPPPPPKRQKRPAKVIDEDVYSDALTHIIARDFFPGLQETEAQQEYIEALDSNDNNWIREAGRKLTQVMTPIPGGQRRTSRGTSVASRLRTIDVETPRDFRGGTPGQASVNSDFAPEEKPEVDINMSLGAFQSKYTSEDNESFNTLLDKQNEKRSARYAFFHSGNKIPSARQIAHRKREQRLLENSNGHTSRALITANGASDEPALMPSNCPSQDLDIRPASVESFRDRQGPRNHFMFDPEGVEHTMSRNERQSELKSSAPPKAVQYSATRFPVVDHTADNAVPPSPSISAIDAAIAGRPRAIDSEAGYTGAETPRVNGYAFVDAEPTSTELGVPVSDEEADAMEREAASRLLPKVGNDGPNPFHLSKRSKREDLHYKLVEKASAGRRKVGRVDQLRSIGLTPGRTPTPKFASSDSIKSRQSMTPAAQKLAERIRTPRRENGMFGAAATDKSSWTPTVRARKT